MRYTEEEVAYLLILVGRNHAPVDWEKIRLMLYLKTGVLRTISGLRMKSQRARRDSSKNEPRDMHLVIIHKLDQAYLC